MLTAVAVPDSLEWAMASIFSSDQTRFCSRYSQVGPRSDIVRSSVFDGGGCVVVGAWPIHRMFWGFGVVAVWARLHWSGLAGVTGPEVKCPLVGRVVLPA